MSKRAVWVCGLCAALSGSCSNSNSGSPDAGSPDGAAGGSSGGGAASLIGTWHLTLGPMGSGNVPTTVTIGQDSLSVESPEFSLTAVRTGNVLAFTDNEAPPTAPAGAVAVLAATQNVGTAAPFNTGILPFNLGGSWTMQAGAKGASPSLTCTLSVTATEIDGACQSVSSPAGPWFNFTTRKMSPAASSLGDFGGHWLNTWTWAGAPGGTFPCTLDFTGNSITTCSGAASLGGSPLAGITFTYDGANTVSGAVQGWAAEYSATR